MDKLSRLLQNLEINADVFFSGNLCGINAFDCHQEASYLHFLETGSLTLTTDQGHSLQVEAGSAVFFPTGCAHDVTVSPDVDAKLVCATIAMPTHHRQMLIDHLPKFLCFDIQQTPVVTQIAEQIFSEAYKEQHGHNVVVNKLCEIFLIQALRDSIQNGVLELATFAAQTHPTLSPLINKISQNPEYDWSVDEMAGEVAMSRSKFALLFKQTLAQSPMEYLTSLRMTKAQNLLKTNRPVGLVANEVGYENASSLAKVFKKHFGITPKQWVKSYFNH